VSAVACPWAELHILSTLNRFPHTLPHLHCHFCCPHTCHFCCHHTCHFCCHLHCHLHYRSLTLQDEMDADLGELENAMEGALKLMPAG
jgi:hypothetical protein